MISLNDAKRQARAAMRHASDYAAWRQAALDLDRLEGLETWKQDDASDDYDWQLISERLRLIRDLSRRRDHARLRHHLRQGLHWNLGNLGNPRLYGRAHFGTKRLVGEYVEAVAAALRDLAELDEPGWDAAAKRVFFAEIAKAFGRSSLMLSGGATLGLFHVGVVKALYREDLLPQVISGSSAGAIVAAVVGTRAPGEIEQLLDPESAYYHFWKLLPWREIWRRRVLMDQTQVETAIAANVHDLSFEQAYRISGRIINVTVSPAGRNQPPRLLNYLTFPYLMVREAVLASAAVPFLFEPVRLASRDVRGRRVPYMPSLRWTDGSLKSDLPILRLRRLHNVNHFVVSQTNPHVLPFLARRAPDKPTLLGGLREYLSSTLAAQARSLMRLGRSSLPVAALERGLEIASDILEQNYRGNINILPDVTLWRYINVTRNPRMETVRRFILEGERATWPRLEMIRIHTTISRALAECVQRVGSMPDIKRRAAAEPVRRRPRVAAAGG
ncbi:MAG: DUF3336 domain-containing protein [Gammaproteobacteria bacterium]|nr:DUF3336 domain-containing protein [Gammaproteobacteria bacterium]